LPTGPQGNGTQPSHRYAPNGTAPTHGDHGVDLRSALEVIGGGLAGSTILDRKSPAMIDRDFGPSFRIDLHHKDLGILLGAARAAGVVTPLGATVAQLMAAAKAQGHGGLDHSALLLVVEQLSGR